MFAMPVINVLWSDSDPVNDKWQARHMAARHHEAAKQKHAVISGDTSAIAMFQVQHAACMQEQPNLIVLYICPSKTHHFHNWLAP